MDKKPRVLSVADHQDQIIGALQPTQHSSHAVSAPERPQPQPCSWQRCQPRQDRPRSTPVAEGLAAAPLHMHSTTISTLESSAAAPLLVSINSPSILHVAPASTAGVERVFSAAGRMHTNLRKSMKDSTLEHSLFADFNTE